MRFIFELSEKKSLYWFDVVPNNTERRSAINLDTIELLVLTVQKQKYGSSASQINDLNLVFIH